MKHYLQCMLFFVSTFFYLGCELPPEAYKCDVTISSVTPSIAPVGQPTSFDVVVSYQLGSLYDSYVVYLGFNDEIQDCYRYVDERTVSSGSGVITFTGVTATPIDWGAAGQFSVAAIVEAQNCQKAHAIQVISLTTGT